MIVEVRAAPLCPVVGECAGYNRDGEECTRENDASNHGKGTPGSEGGYQVRVAESPSKQQVNGHVAATWDPFVGCLLFKLRMRQASRLAGSSS